MDEDDDIHYCLICNKTVSGLVNYIHHKKNECPGRKNKPKLESSIQNTVISDGSEKFENQSFPDLNKQEEQNLNQSYQNDNYGAFSTTSPNPNFHDQNSFLSSGTIVSVDNQLGASTDDYKRILSCTTQSTSSENSFISTNLNIHVPFTSSATIDTNSLSCSLSPIFSTAGNGRSTYLPSLSEDFGLLSASVSGNRNNLPVQGHYKPEGHLKVKVNEIPTEEQITKGECDQVDDFFQSLELMSKTDPRADKSSNFTQLPISNILNNLTFSDDEDLGFDFGDDMSLDSLSDEEDGRAPPGDYTGGKWKPGEKPMAYRKHRHGYRGKWPPGERPPQTAVRGRRSHYSRGKNIALIPGHKPSQNKKASKTSGNKIFFCNFCNITFVNRFQYSNHCGSKRHKENVFGKDSLEQVPKPPTTYNESKTIDEVDIENQENTNQKEVNPDNKAVDDTERNEDNDDDERKHDEKDDDERNDNEDVRNDEEGDDTDEYFDESTSLDDRKTDIPRNINKTDSQEDTDYLEVTVQLHICTVCDKKFHHKYMLARHLLTKFHQNRSLADKDSHRELIKKYHKCIVRLSPFQCSICRFYFNSNEDLMKHLKSEDHKENCEDLVGEIQCTLCHFKTHSREDIDQHFDSPEHVEKIGKRNRICIIKECHTGCVCKFCGLKMHSFERLQKHIKLRHADGEIVEGVQKKVIGVRNRPKCAECGLQLSSVSALMIHMRRKHLDEKPYKCDTCCKAFADKHAYKSHIKSALHNRNQVKIEANEAVTTETGTEGKKRKKVQDEKVHIEMEQKSKEFDKDGEDAPEDEGYANSKGSQVQIKELEGDEEDFHLTNDLDHYTSKDKDWELKTTVKNRRKKKKADVYGYSPKDKKIIKCNHCSFTVTNYDDLRPHYMKEHSAQIKICELCDTVFLSEKALKLHVLSKEHQANIELSGKTNANTDKYYQCDVCKKKFTDEKYCKFHTAYQHFHCTTEQEVYKQNGYKSVTREKFADFLKTVENVDFREALQCPECDTIIKKNNLMVHLRNHTNEKPFHCKICPNTFKSNYTLRKHLLKHFGCLERECDICGKHFNKPSNYEEHMELHALQKANKEKSHICDVCGQAFYIEKQLAVHLRRHRTKDMVCDFPGCHWKFAFRHELNAHRRTHNNERKYLCDTCGFAAFEKYHLRRHEKIHKNERKFHCEYCTYKAGNKTHLKRHMRIHIGSKPFKCPYCSFACNTHENIRKHILETKKHEGLKVYPCKFCDFGTNNSKEFRGHLMSSHPVESDDGARQMPLSVFTGLFQKQEDIDKPAEGTKVIPCKERKIKKKETSEKVNETSFVENENWKKSNRTENIKKDKRKRKVETSDYGIDNQNVQHAYDLSMKERRLSYQSESVKNDFDQMQQPFPTGLILNRQTPSPNSAYVPNMSEPYQRYQGLVNAQIGVNTNAQLVDNSALDLGIRTVQHGSQQIQNSVPGLPGHYPEQGYNKANQEDLLQYHDYSTKFGVTRNREDAESANGNLVIDLNFQHHQ